MKYRCACFAALALVGCAAPQFTLSANTGPFTPAGEINVVDSGTSASGTNSIDDLGLDGEADTLGARLDLKFGSPHLTISTQSSSWDGNGTLSADFGGIPQSTTVSSEFDLAFHRLALTFDVVPTDFVEFGLGLGVSLADLRAEVTDSGTNTTEEVDEIVPIPVLAARLGGRFWWLDLEGLVSGLTVDIEGDEATYLEVDLNAKLAFVGSHGSLHGALVVGWRQIELEVDYEDAGDEVHADLAFDGPYFGLQFGL